MLARLVTSVIFVLALQSFGQSLVSGACIRQKSTHTTRDRSMSAEFATEEVV